MTMTVCHECDKDISDQAAACPHCGVPRKAVVTASSVLTCKTCKLALLPIASRPINALAGVIAALCIVIALLCVLLFSWFKVLIFGGIAVLLLIVGRNRVTRMCCPQCGYTAPVRL